MNTKEVNMADHIISLIKTNPQLLACAKKLEVRELRSFLWGKILRKLGLDYADTIEVSAYYADPQFLTLLEDVLNGIFQKVYKVLVDEMPWKAIFVCETTGDEEDIIVAASWFEDEPEPAV